MGAQVGFKRCIARLLAAGWCLVLVAPVASQPVQARKSAHVDLTARLKEVGADPRLSASAIKTGRQVASFCAHCHGEGGNSVHPAVPNLAGQNPEYLIEQLRQFAEGRRRNEFMEGMIKALSADEKVGIVMFYAGEKVAHRPAADAALAVRGRDYYNQVCFQCHGRDGRGNAQFARIAGQQTEYLSTTLRRYRDGTGARRNPLMTSFTRAMSDADMAAVVAYVSSME
jgi:cbb3-type cytochrome c oxidase subunit III